MERAWCEWACAHSPYGEHTVRLKDKGGFARREGRKPRDASYFSALEGGKSRDIALDVAASLPRDGQYFVSVRLIPTPDVSYVIEKKLPIVAREIPEVAIRARKSIAVKAAPERENPDEVLDFMKVERAGKTELVFRNTYVAEKVTYTNSFVELDADSDLLVFPKVWPDKSRRPEEVWVVFSKKGELFFGRLDCTVGDLVGTSTWVPLSAQMTLP